MAELILMENGLKRRNGAKRKANGVKRKSNGTTKAGAMSFAKKNGLKLVSKVSTLANGKRRKNRRRRRNGILSKPITRRSNGLLGNTKSDAKKVGFLLGGMALTKAAGRFLQSFASPYLAQVGVGQYSEIICDGVVALVAVPMIAGEPIGKEAADWGRLGGLSAVALDAMELFFPDALDWLPFSQGGGVVVANGQAAVTPTAVARIINATSASPDEKAKIAGAMAQLAQGNQVENVGFAGMSGGAVEMYGY